MTSEQKLAEFLGGNKMRGEKLFRAVQIDRTLTQTATIEHLIADITADYVRIFGEQPAWTK